MAVITQRDFQALEQSDSYAVICELLYALKENPKYCVMSELAYILDKDSFLRLIKYFGGASIQVPTVDEWRETVQTIMLYQYFKIDNLSWQDALAKANIEKKDTRKFQKALMTFDDVLRNTKLGRDYK
jgi:hypothetical protein